MDKINNKEVYYTSINEKENKKLELLKQEIKEQVFYNDSFILL